MSTLQFAPWSSDIELAFYSALASRKINFDKLDDAARKIVGRYDIRPNDAPERSARMQIHGNAFAVDDLPHDYYRAEGILKNVNTIEEYRSLDRNAIIDQAAKTIWDAIVDGTIFSCPSLLSSFYTVFYADLKKYKFTYHFAFPALHSVPAWKLAKGDESAQKRLQPAESRLLYDSIQTWKYSVDPRQHGFFLVKRNSPDAAQKQTLPTTPDTSTPASPPGINPFDPPKTPTTPSNGTQWTVGSLAAYEVGFFDNTAPADRFICFADSSTYPDNPGWPLRNLLVLIKHRWRLDTVQVLCFRDKHSTREHPHSLLLHLISTPEDVSDNVAGLEIADEATLRSESMPKATGWERNAAGKLTSQTTDLSAYLDPSKLADQAVDLNLKLMKWRIAPALDLATIQATKCLLLGAGTLGSYVARNLLGWGVRHITFVDNGKVSFSNPVRQPLFRFEDCTNGGRAKAERAAEALREIYPGVTAEGVTLSVPMAGHPIVGDDGEARGRSEFEKLRDLIDQHDVIFLLMDTRESRWLPTVMGKSRQKIVINAALGFDTYVVMRHGVRKPAVVEEKQGGEELGCYFCTDVVAPADSVKDQTLDQQCTVTRPGIAGIASALAGELLVSGLQHPLRARASAPVSRQVQRDTFNAPSTAAGASASDTEETQHPLGLVPHSLRGFLAAFDNVLTRGPAYDSCSACSSKIVDRYEKDGWEFVKRAICEKGWIEEVSGLADVQRRAEEVAAMLEEDEVDEGSDAEAELI